MAMLLPATPAVAQAPLCDPRSLDAAIAHNPRAALGYTNRAYCLMQTPPGWNEPPLSKQHAAEKDLRRALELDPNNADAHRLYGNLAFFQGQYQLAKDQHSAAIRLAPRMAWAYNGRAWAELRLWQFEAAAADFTQTVALDASLRHLSATPQAISTQHADCTRPMPTPPQPAAGGFRCGDNAYLWCRSQSINALTADKQFWTDQCVNGKIAQCN
ncbi:MAG: tetratricopeptide repeat protein [Betaproteobacteria bacterium]